MNLYVLEIKPKNEWKKVIQIQVKNISGFESNEQVKWNKKT